MKAISLWQPWATLLALGAKRGAKGNETRSWWTKVKGTVLIHAAKKFTKEQRELCLQEPFKSVLREYGYDSPDDLPLGKAVGWCDIVDCQKITEENTPGSPEYDFGDYTPGRHFWKTENNEPIKPFPLKGQQSFWDVDFPDDVVEYWERLKDKQECGNDEKCVNCNKFLKCKGAANMATQCQQCSWLSVKCGGRELYYAEDCPASDDYLPPRLEG